MNAKVAVVTGGTRGIGRSISLALGRSGYYVHAIYARNRNAAESLQEEAAAQKLAICCTRADLTDDEHFSACVSKIKSEAEQIHVVVHSAASGVHRQAVDLTLKHLRWTLEINVLAIHRLLLELIPLMPDGGKIIGITSQGATRVLPSYAAVALSKGALDALFRHYAYELAPRGISVNLVCPGLVLTEAVEAFPDKEQRIKAAASKTPTGRLTTPDDIAATVLFLCSDAAAQIIGHTIVIDGGRALI